MSCLLYSTGCGIKHAAIVGGSSVTPYSIPWQVALVDVGGNQPFCGGTLISDRHVLSAAHCMGGTFDVIVGEHRISDASDGIRHEICRGTKHPKYNDNSMNNDFAIIHLKEPVKLGSRAALACLPDSSLGGNRLNKKKMTVSGWGTLSAGGNQPNVLHSVKVKGITNKQCKRLYGGGITGAMLCAGNVKNGGVDSCQGDSGGKL